MIQHPVPVSLRPYGDRKRLCPQEKAMASSTMVTYASTLPHGATSFRAASRLAASFEMSKVGPTIPLKCGLQLAVPLLKHFHDREATLNDLNWGSPVV